MADHVVATELERADEARRQLADDVKQIAHVARAAAHGTSRTLRYVGIALLAAATLSVVAVGTAALLRRRSGRDPEEGRTLWPEVGRKVLLGFTGPLVAHLARRWLLDRNNPPKQLTRP